MVETKRRNSAEWQAEIDGLRAKQAANLARVEELRSTKRSLVLEAAMGGAEAKRRLDRTNADLTAASFAADDLGLAIAEAEDQKAAATAAEDAEAERQRMEQCRKLAAQAVEVSSGYSKALDAAVTAARSVKRLIFQMGELTTDLTTRQGLDRLLGGVAQNPFELNAIHSGLKEFVSLRGEPAHSDRHVRLEESLAYALEHWLKAEESRASLSAEDRKLAAELDVEYAKSSKR